MRGRGAWRARPRVVIGAAAFPIHGYARATLDIDIHPFVAVGRYCPQVMPRDGTATAVMVLAVQVPVVPDANTTP